MSTGAGEIRSIFTSTTGGVMTDEAGAITGELELLTRPKPDGQAVEIYIRYQGAHDLYTVVGSPVRGISEYPDAGEHRQAHGRILEELTTPKKEEAGNELPTSLTS